MMMVVMIFMLMPLWDLLGREDYSRRGAMVRGGYFQLNV